MTNELTADEVKEIAEVCGLGLVKPMYGLRLIHRFDKEMNRHCIFDPIDNDADSHKVLMTLKNICSEESHRIEVGEEFYIVRYIESIGRRIFYNEDFNNYSIARALLAVLKIK